MWNSSGAIRALALLALPLTLTLPAYAQTASTTTVTTTVPAPELNENHMARQADREEMHRIRMEHDILESERDQLKTDCMNAKGQDQTTCHQKWQDLRERREALHQRMEALHAKMQADGIQPHAQHNHTMVMTQQPGGAPAAPAQVGGTPVPPTTLPPAGQ